jgi:hypothetical protein
MGDGNDSFHEFTHRREGAQSVRFRRLSEKQFFVVTAGRHLVFPFLAVFLPTTKPEKSIADNITAAGVFRKRPKPVEKGLFTQTKPMCELVEGIVTVPRIVPMKPRTTPADRRVAESVEGRRPVEGRARTNACPGHRAGPGMSPTASAHGPELDGPPKPRMPVASDLRQEPGAGCDRKAGMSLPVQVWSVQSRAGRTGASLAGVAATRGPKRRQRLDGV